jgi:hypothetical protein
MEKLSMRNRSTRILSRLVFAAGMVALNAYAAGEPDQGLPQHLSGDYRVVITQTCVRTPYQNPPASGFDPDTRQLQVDGETLTAIGSGLLRLSDDGSAQLLDGVQTEVSVGQTAAGNTPVAAPSQFTCSGTHSLDRGKVALSLSCDVSVPQPGVKVTLAPQNFEGYAALRAEALNLTNITGEIQTITVSVGGNAVQQRQRVCTQHALAIATRTGN